MSHTGQFVNLTVSDNTQMQAYVAMPDGTGPFPGLVVFQEAFGVNSNIRNVADRFAAEGYIAIAPELFHRTAPAGFEGSYTDYAALAPHMQGITTETLEADARAVWDWLAQNAHVKKGAIACTGYCLGGRTSFIANTILPFKAAVSYYGGGIANLIKSAPKLHAPMLFFWGGLDKHISAEHIATVTTELTAAQKSYINVVVSYADHGFFNDEKPAYNKEAAAEAWALTLAFLENKLKN